MPQRLSNHAETMEPDETVECFALHLFQRLEFERIMSGARKKDGSRPSSGRNKFFGGIDYVDAL